MLSVGLYLLLEFSEKNSHSGSGGLLSEFSSMQYRTEVLFSASIGHSHHLDHDFIFKVYTGVDNSSHALFFLIFFSAVTLFNWKYSLLRSRVIYNELIGIFLNNSHLKVFNRIFEVLFTMPGNMFKHSRLYYMEIFELGYYFAYHRN